MSEDNSQFWNSFIRAVGAEPRTARPIRGASGLVHPVIAIGVDDENRRVVIISGDPDARSAALAQNDIQTNIPSAKVIVARPIAVSLAKMANIIATALGRSRFNLQALKQNKSASKTKASIDEVLRLINAAGMASALDGISHAKLNAISAWQDIILQISHLQIIKRYRTDPNPSIYFSRV